MLLVVVVLDHVLGTVEAAAERCPVLAMLFDPLHEPYSLLLRDLFPVQARLEVVVPPLAALLCISGAVCPGDLDPVDLGPLSGILVDQACESFVLVGGPRPSLLSWAARAWVHGAEACHDDGDTVVCGVGDDVDNNETGAHQLVRQTCRGVGDGQRRWSVGALKALWALAVL